jgi:tetratricopeptide (TPR) repeat protein
MKAEHRKELLTNSLAQTLEHTVQRIKEGPSRNTILVLVVIALAVGLYFVWRWFSQSANESDSERWVQWDNLAVPAQVNTFLKEKDTEDTTQGRLARFLEARRRLLEGDKDLGFNRSTALENLREAAKLYGELAEQTADRPLLQQEAYLGAGKAAESLGDYDRAKDYYRKLVDKYPDSARGRSAKKQLERLDDPERARELKDLSTEFRPLQERELAPMR